MLTLLVAFAIAPPFEQREIYVAVNGSNRNLGTSEKPVASLDVARDRAREIHCHVILVRGGEYRLSQSLSLDARDSGLRIQAVKGSRPRLVGGVEIPASAVKRCNDPEILSRVIDPGARSKVRWVDLQALGISNLASIQPRGFPQPPRAAPSELFAGRSPMTLARWPNQGYAKVGTVIEPGNGEQDRDKPPRMPVFTVADDRPKSWAKAEDLWLYGYWKYDWADESIRVKGIDPGTGAITLDRPHVYGVDKGTPFFAENLVEELDEPGEYWIDRAKGRLYFIPRDASTARGTLADPRHGTELLRLERPSSGEGPNLNIAARILAKPGDPRGVEASSNPRLEISTLTQPILKIAEAKDVTIRGIDLCVSCGDGAQIKNGEKVRLEGCRMFALGGRGATVEGGHNSGLQSCDLWATGEGGVTLSGGDRNTLQPARNFVDNCDIHDYQRRSQTYRPAVLMSGVGNRVSRCAMHDAPHSAIIFSGNDHVIEYNEFYRTITRTGDGGVVYTGRDWTARGTEIRFNHFHDNIGLSKWEPAIYIDDLGSGINVHDNLIERCHWGFLIGGGRDNVVEGNTIVDCHLAFDCDARGLGWGKSMLPTLTAGLNSVPYQREPWSARYPALVRILDKEPLAPSGNMLRNNVLVRSGKVTDRMEAPFRKSTVIQGNVEASEMLPGRRAPLMGVRPDPLRASLKAPIS
ncbi:MAG: right-handed parallel beta-helix repeat-containing protein [Fimbriimonadales bacterium]